MNYLAQINLSPEVTVAGILAAAVAALWAMHVAATKDTKERLKRTEEKNDGMTKDFIEVRERVGRLEGERDAIEGLSRRVLDTVHEAVAEKKRRKSEAGPGSDPDTGSSS